MLQAQTNQSNEKIERACASVETQADEVLARAYETMVEFNHEMNDAVWEEINGTKEEVRRLQKVVDRLQNDPQFPFKKKYTMTEEQERDVSRLADNILRLHEFQVGADNRIAIVGAQCQMQERTIEQLTEASREVLSRANTLESVVRMNDDDNAFWSLMSHLKNAPEFERLDATVVFDDHHTLFQFSDFFRAVKNKPNIAVVAQLSSTQMVGVTYTQKNTGVKKPVQDPNISAFVFQPDDDENPFEQFGTQSR